MFVFTLHGDSMDAESIQRDFHMRMPRSRAEAETDDVAVVSLRELSTMNLWDEVDRNLLQNPAFHGTVTALRDGQRGVSVSPPEPESSFRKVLSGEVRRAMSMSMSMSMEG